jgi:hypothetical protein
LRRQLVTKDAYDKCELIQENSRTKRLLAFEQGKNTRHTSGKENEFEPTGYEFDEDDAERSIRIAETS